MNRTKNIIRSMGLATCIALACCHQIKLNEANSTIAEFAESDSFAKSDNKERILQFCQLQNANLPEEKINNFAIVDKKHCKLTVYTGKGSIIKEYDVGLGSKIGDMLGYGSALSDENPERRQGEYTTPGEFVLDKVPLYKRTERSKQLYGNRIIYLKGDNKGENSTQEAIHQTSSKYGTNRLKNNTIADNRFSSGCVVMLPDKYDDLMTYLEEGNKVYILPEEQGNELLLVKDGKNYKFVQAYHKDQVRSMSSSKASNVVYDYNTKQAPNLYKKMEGYFYKYCRTLAEK